MKKLFVAAVIAGVLFLATVLMGMAQNDGCLPWQESVGTQGSPFSGTEDRRICR